MRISENVRSKTPSSFAYYIIIFVGVRGELGGFFVIDRAQRMAREGSLPQPLSMPVWNSSKSPVGNSPTQMFDSVFGSRLLS